MRQLINEVACPHTAGAASLQGYTWVLKLGVFFLTRFFPAKYTWPMLWQRLPEGLACCRLSYFFFRTPVRLTLFFSGCPTLKWGQHDTSEVKAFS